MRFPYTKIRNKDREFRLRIFLMLSGLLWFGCGSPNHSATSRHTLQTIDIQGHRGCRGLMPENTIPAMLHALDLGVTTLETDVVITADSIPLLSHEPFFSHEITLKADGLPVTEEEERSLNIYHMSLEETGRYDVGRKPHPRFPHQQKFSATKPTLEALFDSVAQYMSSHERPYPRFNIETKSMPETDDMFHPRPETFVRLIMDVVIRKKMQDLVTIQSFDIRTLQELHRKYPKQACALLIEEHDIRPFEAQLAALGFNPGTYSPYHGLVTKKLVEDMHSRGIKVIPWTVNDRPTIDRMLDCGVDGIITDYPDLFSR